jgi:phage baseplate assembly protein W
MTTERERLARDDPSFIGKGFQFPLRVDARGGIALSEGSLAADSAIRVILATAPGERVMRPAFGCKIWDLLFEPVNANTLGLMAQAVREAVAQWEPRVEVEDVRVQQDSVEASLVHIDIHYRFKATNDRRNLVYPFYTIPREEG